MRSGHGRQSFDPLGQVLHEQIPLSDLEIHHGLEYATRAPITPFQLPLQSHIRRCLSRTNRCTSSPRRASRRSRRFRNRPVSSGIGPSRLSPPSHHRSVAVFTAQRVICGTSQVRAHQRTGRGGTVLAHCTCSSQT